MPGVYLINLRANRRASLIKRAREQREEINQYFRDVQCWNDEMRKPHEARIVPDPDGTLKRISDALDAVLKNELTP